MAINVRFIHNFIITIVQTVEVDGNLVAQEKQIHILMGDVYGVSQYQRNPDGRLDLEFPETSPLAGLAQGVEPDYCELTGHAPGTSPETSSGTSAGCGTCGNKQR